MTYESVDGTRGDITITMKASIAMPSGVIKNDQKITEAWSPDKSYVKADVKEPVTVAVTDFNLICLMYLKVVRLLFLTLQKRTSHHLRRIS